MMMNRCSILAVIATANGSLKELIGQLTGDQLHGQMGIPQSNQPFYLPNLPHQDSAVLVTLQNISMKLQDPVILKTLSEFINDRVDEGLGFSSAMTEVVQALVDVPVEAINILSNTDIHEFDSAVRSIEELLGGAMRTMIEGVGAAASYGIQTHINKKQTTNQFIQAINEGVEVALDFLQLPLDFVVDAGKIVTDIEVANLNMMDKMVVDITHQLADLLPASNRSHYLPEFTLTNGGLFNTPFPDVSGLAHGQSNLTVKFVDINGKVVEVGKTMVYPDGHWSYIPRKPLLEGYYDVTIISSDTLGHISPRVTRIIVIDTTAPLAAVINPIDNTIYPPQVSGFAEPQSIVRFTLRDCNSRIISVGDVLVASNGTFTWFSPANIAAGKYNFITEVIDRAGNVSRYTEKQNIVFCKPTVRPGTLTINSPGSTNQRQPTLTGSGVPGTQVTVTITDPMGVTIAQGSTTVNADGTWTFTPSVALPEGSYMVVATGENSQGETVNSDPVGMNVDTTAPAPGVVGNIDTSLNPPVFQGSAEPGATVSVVVKDAEGNVVTIGSVIVPPSGNWSYTPTVPLDDGEYTASVVVTDSAGNASEPSPDSSFTMGGAAVPPNTLGINPIGYTNQNRPIISGGGIPGDVVTVDIRNPSGGLVSSTPVVVGPDGTWTYTPSQSLSDGHYFVTATGKDTTGSSTSTGPVQMIVDTVAPNPPLSGPVDTTTNPPVFSGVAEPGSTVTVVVKDSNGNIVDTGSVIAGPDGAWSFTPPNPLHEGQYSGTLTSTDKAGNTSNIANLPNFNVSEPGSMAPATLGIDPLGTVGSSTPQITGTGVPGTVVTVVITDPSTGNVINSGSATVTTDGTWTYVPSTPLSEGSYSVVATGQNSAGQIVSTPPQSMTVDLTAPAPPTFSFHVAIDENPPALAGNSEPGTTVNVFLTYISTTPSDEANHNPNQPNGGPSVRILSEIPQPNVGDIVASGTAVATIPYGYFTWTPPFRLPVGRYEPHAFAVDLANNLSETIFGIPFNIYGAMPTVAPGSGLSVNPPGFLNSSSPTISGTGLPGTVITLDVKDKNGNIVSSEAVTVNPDGTWSSTIPSMSDGEYGVTVTGMDSDGSITTTPPQTMVVDTVPPVLPEVSAVDTSSNPPTISGVGTPGDLVEVSIMDTEGTIVSSGNVIVKQDGTWSFTPNAPMPDGSYIAGTVSTDKAGNTSEYTTSPPFVVGYIPTTVPGEIGVNPPGLSNTGVPEISGTGVPGDIIIVEITDENGNVVDSESVVVKPDGTWTYTPSTELPDGHYDITGTGVGPDGDVVTTPSVPLIVDSTPPTSPDISVVDVSTNPPTFSGSAEPGSTVTVEVVDSEGNIIETITGSADADGNFTLSPESPLPEGTYTGEITSTDAAGNSSGTTTTPPFTISAITTVKPGTTTTTTTTQLPTTTSMPTVPSGVLGVNPLGLTNNSMPEITGGGIAGSQIIVEIVDSAGVVVQTATVYVGQDGTWSYTPSSLIPDGEYAITATGTDSTGSTSTTLPVPLIVDTIPPAVPTITTIDSTTNPPVVTGTGEPGSTIVAQIQGTDNNFTITVTVQVGDDGTFTIIPDAAMPIGSYNVSTVATDPAGNSSPQSSPDSFSITETSVTSAPVTTTTGPVVIVSSTSTTGAPGLSTSLPTVTSPRPSISTSLPTVTSPKPSVSTTSVPVTTTYVPTIPPGTLGVNRPAIDNTGTPQLSGSGIPGTSVTVDITNSDGQVINTAEVPVNEDGTWTYTPTAVIPDGSYNITATGVDETGTTSTTDPVPLTVDSTAPPTPTVPAIDNTANPPTVSGSAEPGSTVTVEILDSNGNVVDTTTTTVADDGTYNVTPTVELPDGDYTASVISTDEAGNSSAPAVSDLFKVGVVTTTVAPGSLAINEPGAVATDTPTITGGAVANTPVTIDLIDSTGAVVDTIEVTADATGAWTYTFPSAVSDGSYTLVAHGVDGMGNTVPTDPVTLIVDTTPPADIVLSVDNTVNPPIATGSGEEGSTIDITLTNEAGDVLDTDSVTIPASTRRLSSSHRMLNITVTGTDFSYTPPMKLEVGNYFITVVARDSVGNPSNESVHPFTVTLLRNPALIASNNDYYSQLDITPASIDNATNSVTAASIVAIALTDSIDASILSSVLQQSLSFVVDPHTTRNVIFQAQSGGVQIASSYDLFIYKLDPGTTTYKYYDSATKFLTAVLLGGKSNELPILLTEGDFVVFLQPSAGVTLLTGYTLMTVADTTYDYNTALAVSGGVTGNVITDVDNTDGSDQTSGTTTIREVKSISADGSVAETYTVTGPVVIPGLYGSLSINPDGSFTYTISSTYLGPYDVVEKYQYDLVNVDGYSNVANFNISFGTLPAGEIVLNVVPIYMNVTPSVSAGPGVPNVTDFSIISLGSLTEIIDPNTVNLSGQLTWDVAADTVRDLTFVANAGGVSVGQVYQLSIYKLDTVTGNYVAYYNIPSWFTVVLLGGASDPVTIGFDEGKYVALLGSTSGLGVLSGSTLKVTADVLTDYNVPVTGTYMGSGSGTVATDPADVCVTVAGAKIPSGSSNSAIGSYGTFVLNSDCSWTYSLGVEQAAPWTPPYGMIDSFTYLMSNGDADKTGIINLLMTLIDAVDDTLMLDVGITNKTVTLVNVNSNPTLTATYTTTFVVDAATWTVATISATSTGTIGSPTLSYKLTHTASQVVKTGGGTSSSVSNEVQSGFVAGEWTLTITATGGSIPNLSNVTVLVKSTYRDQWVPTTPPVPAISVAIGDNDVGTPHVVAYTINNATVSKISRETDTITITFPSGTLSLTAAGILTFQSNSTTWDSFTTSYIARSAVGELDDAIITVTINATKLDVLADNAEAQLWFANNPSRRLSDFDDFDEASFDSIMEIIKEGLMAHTIDTDRHFLSVA